MSKAHTFQVRVYFEDTDAGGMVYYANYLKFAERARTEMLRDFGLEHSSLLATAKQMFVVKTCHLNCLASARLDDVLEIKTCVKKMGRVKLDLFQEIFRGDQPIATLEVVLAYIDGKSKPIKIDDSLRHMFTTNGSDSEG